MGQQTSIGMVDTQPLGIDVPVIGCTWETLFSDNFNTEDFSKWDGSYGDVSIVTIGGKLCLAANAAVDDAYVYFTDITPWGFNLTNPSRMTYDVYVPTETKDNILATTFPGPRIDETGDFTTASGATWNIADVAFAIPGTRIHSGGPYVLGADFGTFGEIFPDPATGPGGFLWNGNFTLDEWHTIQTVHDPTVDTENIFQDGDLIYTGNQGFLANDGEFRLGQIGGPFVGNTPSRSPGFSNQFIYLTNFKIEACV